MRGKDEINPTIPRDNPDLMKKQEAIKNLLANKRNTTTALPPNFRSLID